MNLVIKNREKIKDALFFLIVFCVIFDYAPKALWVRFWGLGGPYSTMVGVYPIMAGFLLTAYLIYKGYIHFWNRNVAIFFAAAFCIYEASAIHGLFIYPYWDLVLNAPEPQIEKLPWALELLHRHNINISYEQLSSVWIFARSVKSTFFDLFYRFGFSYMIYLWYQGNFKRAWNVFVKGLLAGLTLFVVYGFIDVFYLHGSSVAAAILTMFNPMLHDIGKIHDWWPPLLWPGQFRSVFGEPSRVGNYIAFVLPILFLPIISKEKSWKYYIPLVFLVSYMVFLTHARTAVSMLLGIQALTLFSLLLLRWGKSLKQFMLIICIVAAAFIVSIIPAALVLNGGSDDGMKASLNRAAVEYMENNVGSLASSNKRSNQARYALIKSNVKIGKEHPLIGVGPMLNGAYVVDHFDDFDKQSGEVQQWIKAFQEMGPLKHNFDAMNEYISVFATTGILGLLCLLFPFGYGCIGLLRRIRHANESDPKVKWFGLLIATVSSLVAGSNGSLILIYAIWILLPMVYIALTDKEPA